MSVLPEIDKKLLELKALSRQTLAARCEIQQREEKDYIPSECLMTLVREHRSTPFDACGEVLFKTLIERVLRGLPRAEFNGEDNESCIKGNIRDEAKFHFLEMLGRDREQEYVEKLDYYEIRFASALKTLRIDIERKAYRREEALAPLEIDPETGEFPPDVQKAMTNFSPFDSEKLQDFDYRSTLNAAISYLPEIQKAIIEMIRKGISIESQDSGTVTISKVLQKTPKTIATHRDKAYASLRAKLIQGESL